MMEIKILTYLKDNPAINPGNKEYEGRIEPMSSSEVQNHEEIYNNGKPFPEAVRSYYFWREKDVMCLAIIFLILMNFRRIRENGCRRTIKRLIVPSM
ncbi:hypothetical protein EJ377_15155 [Chryseobacterium arthrosphaerae]|uniref:Uncharacterized protein n=1 Tax=Chryseobacterium arthrosphaerae TaxID=651561 RepID=A0A3S0NKN6_9FLAO|nr:hypothetical protein EJ377_15155 [Chryseobacterium arthrosphaerae]